MEEEEENLDHCSRFHLWLTFLSIIDISSEYFRNILKKSEERLSRYAYAGSFPAWHFINIEKYNYYRISWNARYIKEILMKENQDRLPLPHVAPMVDLWENQ